MATGAEGNLRGMWGSAANDVFAVGYNGTILHYDGIREPQTGSLTVTLSPQGTIDAWAQWRVDGGPWRYSSGATVSGLVAGQHTVDYRGTAGWTKPSSQLVTMAGEQTTTATGTYTNQSGSLKVTITPQGAIDAWAGWWVDDGSWVGSGTTISDLEIGRHTIRFRDISGWIKPADQILSVENEQTTMANGRYLKEPLEPTVTIRAVDPKASEARQDMGKFVVTCTGDISQPLTVNYKVAGTAINSIDFKYLRGKLVIPAGKASKSLYLTPFNDRIKEPKETVKVILLKSATYHVGTPASATVYLTHDD
jgi:hypothetical protein